MEELEKMAFKCLKCGQYFYVKDGKLVHVKEGEDFEFSGMTMCSVCAIS